MWPLTRFLGNIVECENTIIIITISSCVCVEAELLKEGFMNRWHECPRQWHACAKARKIQNRAFDALTLGSLECRTTLPDRFPLYDPSILPLKTKVKMSDRIFLCDETKVSRFSLWNHGKISGSSFTSKNKLTVPSNFSPNLISY